MVCNCVEVGGKCTDLDVVWDSAREHVKEIGDVIEIGLWTYGFLIVAQTPIGCDGCGYGCDEGLCVGAIVC